MARWAPQKQDVLDAFAQEIVSTYPSKAAVAVLARDAEESRVFGAGIAEAITATGRAATVSESTEVSPDAITIVVGPVALDEANWTRWNVPVWLDHDADEDRGMRRKAGVVFDVSDPEHPRRRFADSC
jgi:hypothetical protein